MQEYKSSKLLKGIEKQSNQEHDIEPKQFKGNKKYQPPVQIEPSIEIQFNLDHFIQEQPRQDNENEKKKKKIEMEMEIEKPRQYVQQQIEQNEDLPEIMIPSPPSEKEFEHMKPIVLGEDSQQINRKDLTFLQALQQGDCILQLPNKLPFKEIGQLQQDESKSESTELIQYYDECYDSSGFLLNKKYKSLSNQKAAGISLGKMIINEDGKAIWKAGREEFNIERGIGQNIDNKIIMIDNEEGKCKFFEMNEKWIVQPNY